MKRKIVKNKLAQTLMIEVTYIFKIYRINRKYCGDRKILMGLVFFFFLCFSIYAYIHILRKYKLEISFFLLGIRTP